ncbi:hypothetical protein QOZ80_1AG0004870 [Eleusine coracana subsp. coracana]|nr:hypothetical protein QOZ80_1AG0004870 [Eleusine coracana subsp. coracana]
MMRRRGIGSFCHGDASTSTLHHHQLHCNKEQQLGLSSSGVADAASSSFLTVPASVVGSCVAEGELSGCTGGGGPSDQHPAAVTLEQMILQLDLEEAAARRVKAAAEEEDDGWCPRRMSCVDAGSSAAADHVLRSARDALSQYPRFSLDGRDAMYRASFSGCYYDDDGPGLGLGAAAQRPTSAGYEMDLERTLRMPATVAGESVVWCKPGVVAKLMGLDAVPVPVRGGGGLRRRKASGGAPLAATTCAGGGGVRKQPRLARRTAGQEELAAFQKERLFMALHGYDVVGAAGAAACHAGGAHRSAVGPQAAGGVISRHGGGWQFGLRH